MKVACVTRDDLPDWEIDDARLHAALAARGAVVERPVWSNPSVDWSAYDVVLLRTPWDYQERVEAFLAWARRVQGLTRLEHGVDVVAWNARKTYLRDLAQRGVPVAPSLWLEPEQSVALGPLMDTNGWTRGFLKPVVGATARHTLRFGRHEVESAEAHVAAVAEPMIFQPYLPAVESEGELSVVIVQGAVTHGVRKVPQSGDYRVQDDFGAHDEPWEPTSEMLALAEQALAEAGQHLGRTAPFLYGRVDALRHEGRLVLNELELIEPSLFFRHGPHAAERLAEALVP